MINSKQTIFSYGEVDSFFTFDIARDYMGMKQDLNDLLGIVNNKQFEPQFGEGNPEGSITSNAGRLYFDTSGSDAVMYVNKSINSKTEWLKVEL
jgi:hypothetical protein